MNTREVGQVIEIYRQLKKIAKSIENLDVQDCNFGLTEKQEKREEKLVLQAEELAQQIGLHAFHQGDPRGCSLYLVENPQDYSNYNSGVAIY